MRRIVRVNDPAIKAIGRIYEASIPASERKPTAWIGEATTRADFAVLCAEAHGDAVGFATVFVPASSMALLEYLAVDAHRRGGGVGTLLFNAVVSMVREQPLLLEVERPIDDVSRRRIDFYLRSGCELIDGIDYILPLPAHPPTMRLMKHPSTVTITRNDLRQSLEQVYMHVYAQMKDDPRIEQMVKQLGSVQSP